MTATFSHLTPALALALAVVGCASEPDSDARASAAQHAPAADVVALDTAAIRMGGIVVGTAEAITTIPLPVTGTITFDANRVTYIGARTNGRVVALRTDLGRRVRHGEILIEFESADVGQIRADAQRAEALLRIATENRNRERRLEQQGISSRKELLDAEAEVSRSEAELVSARDRLDVLGAGHGTGGHFDTASPIDGTVVERSVNVGQMATPSDTLVTVADLSRVWIVLDIFERDLTRVRVGQAVSVTTEAYQGRAFPGRIVYVGEVLDPALRTVRARVEIPNADGALRPGMFARGSIQVRSRGAVAVSVPQAAVQEVAGKSVVFVPGAEPGEFRAVPVEVGEAIAGGRVVITGGLAAGDRIVVAGAFALRSEIGAAGRGGA